MFRTASSTCPTDPPSGSQVSTPIPHCGGDAPLSAYVNPAPAVSRQHSVTTTLWTPSPNVAVRTVISYTELMTSQSTFPLTGHHLVGQCSVLGLHRLTGTHYFSHIICLGYWDVEDKSFASPSAGGAMYRKVYRSPKHCFRSAGHAFRVVFLLCFDVIDRTNRGKHSEMRFLFVSLGGTNHGQHQKFFLTVPLIRPPAHLRMPGRPGPSGPALSAVRPRPGMPPSCSPMEYSSRFASRGDLLHSVVNKVDITLYLPKVVVMVLL